jgi:hypothetical protein
MLRGPEQELVEQQEGARPDPSHASAGEKPEKAPREIEIGGPKGPEPTRFGDWERAGRCIDF